MVRLVRASFICILLFCQSHARDPRSAFKGFFRKFNNVRNGRFSRTENAIFPTSEPPESSSYITKELVTDILDKTISSVLMILTIRFATKVITSAIEKLLTGGSSFRKISDSFPVNATDFLAPNCTLNSYELDILSSLVTPSSINQDLDDIGGLRSVKMALIDQLLPFGIDLPVDLAKNPLYLPSKSVLLYGPPGCGKLACSVIIVVITAFYCFCRFALSLFVYLLCLSLNFALSLFHCITTHLYTCTYMHIHAYTHTCAHTYMCAHAQGKL